MHCAARKHFVNHLIKIDNNLYETLNIRDVQTHTPRSVSLAHSQRSGICQTCWIIVSFLRFLCMCLLRFKCCSFLNIYVCVGCAMCHFKINVCVFSFEIPRRRGSMTSYLVYFVCLLVSCRQSPVVFLSDSFSGGV